MRLFALAVPAAALLLTARANATPICGSVAAFNASGKIATSGTLTFKVTGIDPNAGKGALASLIDARSKTAAGEPCAGTYFKVYGPGVDLGKVKDELFNVCCTSCATCTTDRSGTLGCETWAGEARSSVIFTAPTQTCDIEVRFGGTPNKHSYAISCDDGKGDNGVGDNTYELGVTQVTLLEGYGGVGKISGATILSEQFCYEAATVAPDAGVDSGASPSTLEVPVAEDVTAASATPTSVYADVNDLACGTGEEVFLKFVVPDSVGTVKKATLTLTNAGTISAEGDGGAIYRTENAWSETTLTWNTRPPKSGSPVASVGAVASNQVVTLDVTAAIPTRGTYSFVMVQAGTNGTHFSSKEVSAARAPKLTLEYVAEAPPPPPATTTDAGISGTDTGVARDGGAAPRAADEGSDFAGSCSTGSRRDTTLLSAIVAALLLSRSRRRAARDTASRARRPDSAR